MTDADMLTYHAFPPSLMISPRTLGAQSFAQAMLLATSDGNTIRKVRREVNGSFIHRSACDRVVRA